MQQRVKPVYCKMSEPCGVRAVYSKMSEPCGVRATFLQPWLTHRLSPDCYSETGEGRIESNDNPADSIGKVKTSSGDDEQMHAVSISNEGIKDGVSNTQNQQRLINSK